MAASPDTVKRLIALGFDVIVQFGAGQGSRTTDNEFTKAGATLGKMSDVAKADVVLRGRRPADLKGNKSAVVIAMMNPYGNDDAVQVMAKAGVTAFSMEFMPRISRAQVMTCCRPRRTSPATRR